MIDDNSYGHSRSSEPIRSSFAEDDDFSELLEFFVDAIPERRENLLTQYKQKNFQELQTIAHQLKGAGGGYGFEGLTTHAANLEHACKQQNTSQIEETIQRLLDYMERITV